MRRLFIGTVVLLTVSLPLAAVSVSDFEGRTVSVTVRPQRIISLAPIATRVIAQFGILERVVGLDQKSLNMELLPKPISEQELPISDLGEARSVNEEAILRLRPDIIITQYDKAQADRLSERTGVPVLCIQNRNRMDYELFEILGKMLFVENHAAKIVSHMKNIVMHAENLTRTNAGSQRPRVYVATDVSLLNTFPQDPIVVMCGGRNAAEEITTMNYWGGATVDAEFFLRSKPDIIIVWIAFNAPQKIEELKKALARREYANIPAIKNNRIYTFLTGTAGKDYFFTMVSISETLHHFYPGQYTAQMLEQDMRAHLNVFYPSVSYAEYKLLRDRVNLGR